jgi:hypothetical protein
MKLISIEDQIIKATIALLLAEGYMLAVDDGGEIALQKTQDADATLAAMRTTDEDYLIVYRQGYGSRRVGWVRFIYGNDGTEVINDYTVNLEPIMVKIMDLITEYEDGG